MDLAKIGENWRKLCYDGERNKIDRINAFYGLIHAGIMTLAIICDIHEMINLSIIY